MVSLAVLGFIRCQSWLNFQNIGQGWDHLSRVGSIREHTPCTMSLGMRDAEHEYRLNSMSLSDV